jgi:hypothetical protein
VSTSVSTVVVCVVVVVCASVSWSRVSSVVLVPVVVGLPVVPVVLLLCDHAAVEMSRASAAIPAILQNIETSPVVVCEHART